MTTGLRNRRGDEIALLPLGAHGVSGKGAMPIKVRDAVTLMNVLAFHMSRSLCDAVECDDCNRLNALYWWLDAGLISDERVPQQAYLRRAGVPLPNAPWEDVDATGRSLGVR